MMSVMFFLLSLHSETRSLLAPRGQSLRFTSVLEVCVGLRGLAAGGGRSVNSTVDTNQDYPFSKDGQTPSRGGVEIRPVFIDGHLCPVWLPV